MMLLVLSLVRKCDGKDIGETSGNALNMENREDKRIEERAQGTAGILGREDPNPDLER
jgi:hypothetical protein